jgi:hypothetical protein
MINSSYYRIISFPSHFEVCKLEILLKEVMHCDFCFDYDGPGVER